MILKDFTGGIFKLYDGDDPMLGFVLKDAHVQTNAGKMAAKITISTEIFDRSGDEVIQKGWELSDHRRIPVALLNHIRTMPVGNLEDPLRQYTCKLHNGQLEGETFFSQHTKLGEQGFRLVESGVLRGVSPGFMPGVVEKSAAGGRRFVSGHRLIEVSHVVLPDNQDCIVTAVEKGFGGKQLCDPLLDLLRPYILERPASVVGGFDPAPSTTKTVTKGAADMDPKKKPEDDFAPPVDPNADPAADPNAVATEEPPADDPTDMEPGHDEVVSQSLEAAGMAILSAYHAGDLDAESALSKIETLFETNEKLSGAGSDEEMPDVSDVEEDPEEPDKEEKAFYRDTDATFIQKAYAFMGALIAAPKLDKAKVDKAARQIQKGLASVDPVVKMVRKSREVNWGAVFDRLKTSKN